MVELDLYRARIGLFQSCNKKFNKMMTISSVLIASYVSYYIFLEYSAWPSKGCLSGSYRYVQKFITNEIWCFGVSWQYMSATNSLCHAIHGNRRNANYKYCAWNCDKGFIGENKIDDLKFTIQKYSPHIIGVSEVNIVRNEANKSESNTILSTAQVLEKFAIQNYKIFLPDSWTLFDKARVIVYAREDINVKQIKLDQFSTHLQCVNLEIGFGKSKKHFYSFFYREWTACVPQQSSSQKDDLQLLLDNWRNNSTNNRDLITMGDMNLCAKKMDTQGFQYSDLASLIKDFEMEENCTQLVHDYTRLRLVNNELQRSCLDHVYVNCVSKMSAPDIVPIGRSDHMGLIISKASKEMRSYPRTTLKRVYKNFDKESFKNDIAEAKRRGKFAAVLSSFDENIAYEKFCETYLPILNHHAPLKVIQNRTSYVPYISDELKSLMVLRNAAKSKSIEVGTAESFKDYRRLRNLVSSKLKTAEKDYYKSKFNNPEASTRDLWQNAYQVVGKVRSVFPSQIIVNGRLISKPIDMATEVNNFFTHKIKNIKDKLSALTNEDAALKELRSFLSSKTIPQNGFSIHEVSEQEMKNILRKMSGKKSCGLDWICGFSLKIAAEFLEPEIRWLVNITINNHSYPESWKCSRVLPCFKNKGSQAELKNYRPISNLQEISKLAEKCVYDQMYTYLENNNLINASHHGFLKNCSTATALQEIYDKWLNHLEKGKLAGALFLDLSAGFDVINHSLLLKKLALYSFSEESILWFKSYILGRSQCVQVESKISDPLPLPWGVPQGSILGPLLFLLYINELAEAVKVESNDEDADVIVYADDNTPISADRDPDILEVKMQNVADLTTDWFRRNDMVCSSDKTKLLIVGTAANRAHKLEKNNRILEIKLDDNLTTETKSERLLGLVVNNNGTWKTHLYGDKENEGLIPQLSKRVGILKRLREYLPDSRFRVIANGLFFSKLIYGISVWGGVWGLRTYDDEERKFTAISKEDMRRLQVLQNCVMRLMTRLEFGTSTEELCRRSNNLSVHQLVAYHSVNQVYRIYNTQRPSYHYNRLFHPARTGTTAARIDFRLSLSRSSFFFQASRLWNLLPDLLKTCSSYDVFKNGSKQWTRNNIDVRPS